MCIKYNKLQYKTDIMCCRRWYFEDLILEKNHKFSLNYIKNVAKTTLKFQLLLDNLS